MLLDFLHSGPWKFLGNVVGYENTKTLVRSVKELYRVEMFTAELTSFRQDKASEKDVGLIFLRT